MHAETIEGHPVVELQHDDGPPTLITVCAECGHVRTVLFLSRDRWFCMSCKTEGATAPNLFPIG